MDTTFRYNEKIRPIGHIQFAMLGGEEIKRMSALSNPNGIEQPELYDNMEPKLAGLIDPRLGTALGSTDCATCGFDTINCIGHFGHIELADPVLHIGHMQNIRKILGCVCLKCSKLLIYKNEEELYEMLKNKSNKAKLSIIKELTKSVTHCAKTNYGCGTPVSKIKIEVKKTQVSVNLVAEMEVPSEEGDNIKKKIRQVLTSEMCLNIIKNISDSDCRLMGIDPTYSRPEYAIHTTYPVPPVAVRPSAKVDFLESSTKEDDLTHKLADIVKANNRIRKLKENINDANSKYGPDHQHLLEFHVHTNFDNESSILPKSEQRNKVTKSLSSRLKGKEGRVRNNLMGKRCNFSSRTVITADPTTNMNELRVPVRIAKILTYPEVVTPNNIDKLTELVRNGRDVYPGANFIFPVGSMNSDRRVMPIDLRYRKENKLRFGDIVERQLVDGDVVLLNRQPTLHKLSMMAFKIKVIDDDSLNTFGMSPSVTTPFNADFDGDF